MTEVGDGFARLSTKKKDLTTGRLLDEREERDLPLSLTIWCAGKCPFCILRNEARIVVSLRYSISTHIDISCIFP